MSYKLTDLLNDSRLERLLSLDNRSCALQLWVLQLQYGDIVENRLVYGRLLPYGFSNNCWSFSDKDTSQSFGEFRASVTQLNLYVDSPLCHDLLSMMCNGQSIDSISTNLKLKIPTKLSERFGYTTFIGENASFRPVAYLLNRNSHVLNTLVSPHRNAGALSASIGQSDKQALFSHEGNYDTSLTSMIVSRLNTDTGMDFGGTDINRLGDLELLIFPMLDDNERKLLTVKWTEENELNIKFISTQISAFNSFQFHLTIENDNQVICSRIAVAKVVDEGVFEYTFKLDHQLIDIADSARVDIFSFEVGNDEESYLCCSWKSHYVREADLQISMMGNELKPVKFDWLEKTTNSKMTDRVSHALSFSAKNHTTKSRVGELKIDKWAPENQALRLLFKKLYPPKSEGGFFPRWGQSNGEGRLQFVEWFKELIENNSHQHIAIFDPYFEDVGSSLLTLYASPNSEYTIFRTMPKLRDEDVNEGIDNLIANCEHNRKRLQRSKVKIYGLKEGRLHDRYILVIGQHGLPAKGFHLSNSFQKVAENYPLLITPIPMDILYKTNQYTFDLIQEANNYLSGEADTGSIALIFDSTSSTEKMKQYEPLSILKNELAGSILSMWLKQPLLNGLYGDELKNKMVELGFLQDGSLHSLPKDGLLNYIDEMEGELPDLIAEWEVLGDILANTIDDDSCFNKLQSKTRFLLFLAEFLSYSFQRKQNCDEQEVSVIDPSYFKESLKEFIHSSTQIYQFTHRTKHNILTWAEFYAVRYLWQYSPKSLFFLIEKEAELLSTEYQPVDTVRLSILGQAVSEIALCTEFHAVSEEQQKQLIESKIAMMNWFGWNTLEQHLQSSTDFELSFSELADFTYEKQVQFIGWTLSRNAEKSDHQKIYEKVILKLYNLLPKQIQFSDLKLLIDSIRGHMHQISWTEPWLFSDIVEPLLKSNRVNYDDVCKIWLQDLIDLLIYGDVHHSLSFSREREGQTTNVCAYLWANSTPTQKNKCIKKISEILGKQKRIILQPLASTSNRSKWDEALKVSLWILVFAKWCKYYLDRSNASHHAQLNVLLDNATSLAMIRPSNEWLPHSTLFLYLEEVEERLFQQD